MKYTRDINAEEFGDLIWPGIKYSFWIILIVGILGSLLANAIHDAEKQERSLYLALQGKDNDTKSLQTVVFAKEIYQGNFQNWNESQWESLWHALQGSEISYGKAMDTKTVVKEIHDGKFTDWENIKERISEKDLSWCRRDDCNVLGRNSIYFALANWQKTIEFLNNPEKEVPLEDTWTDWVSWFWNFFVGVILVSLLSLSYFFKSEESNWWKYPWKKWWAYPALTIMFPYVILTQPFVLLYAMVNKVSGREKKQKTAEALKKEQKVIGKLREEIDRDINKQKEKFGEIKELASKYAVLKDEFAKRSALFQEAQKAYEEQKYSETKDVLDQIQKGIAGLREKAKQLKEETAAKEFEKRIARVNKTINQSRKNFAKIGEISLVKNKTALEMNLKSLREKLSEFGKQIEQTNRDIAQTQRRLNAVETALISEKDREKLFEAFDRIRGLPLVKGLEVDGEKIRIFTDKIFVFWKGNKYKIGNFLIGLEIGNQAVMIENLVNTNKEDIDQNHIYGRGGSFCFGTLNEPIQEALNKNNYLFATLLILQALQTGEGSKLEDWEKVKL